MRSRPRSRTLREQPFLLALLAAGLGAIGVSAWGQDAPRPDPFVRSTSREGFTGFETGTRVYARNDGSGPTVALVGVVHIGDPTYYDELVGELSRYDAVLYESVLPRGAFGTGGATDLDRQRSTQDAMLFLRELLARYAVRHRALPESLVELRAFVAARDTRLARPFDLACRDGWGRPIAYRPTGGFEYELTSLGADGVAGGHGTGLDLTLRQLPLAAEREATAGAGPDGKQRDLYLELADALDTGLQVRSIDYDRTNWIPADLPMEELLDRLWRRGERSATIEMLGNPDGFQQGVVRFLLSFVSKSPSFKRMVIQALGSAGERSGGRSGSGLGAVDERIILDERNEAVMDRLRALLASEEPPASVAIFYGAAHMPDFEERLRAEFALEPTDSRWYRAMFIDEWSAERIERRLAQLKVDRERLLREDATANVKRVARIDASILLLEERALLAARARARANEASAK